MIFYTYFEAKIQGKHHNLLTNIKKTYLFESFFGNCLRTQKKVRTFAIANKKDKTVRLFFIRKRFYS